MKLHVGAVPEGEDFAAGDARWRPMREPSPVVALWVVSIPVAIVLLVGFGLLWSPIVPLLPPADRLWALGGFVIVTLVMIPLHEGVHMLMQPGNGRRSASGDLVGITLVAFVPRGAVLRTAATERSIVRSAGGTRPR